VPAVLREEPQYRILFAGQFLSIIGDRVTMLVLPFAVLSLRGSVGDVAAVSFAQFLPFVLLSLPAGVWADRWNRKNIVITSDAVRLVSQATAAVLLLSGHATVVELITLAAVYGAADAFFSPAITGLIPMTVRPHNIQPANALRGATYSLGSIVGPMLGGLLIVLVGPGGSFAFDSLTFLVSVVIVLRLRPRAPDSAAPDSAEPDDDMRVDNGMPQPAHEPFIASLRGGWREVRTRPWVLAFLGGFSAYSILILPAIFVLAPVLMQQKFDGASSWALTNIGFGVGALAGDLLLLRWRPRFAMRIASFALVGSACQAIIIATGPNVWVITALQALTGACVTGCFSLWETSLQEHIPGRALSRVSSFDYLASGGFIPLGNIIAGVISTAVGVQTALIAMGAVGIAAAIAVVAVPSVRHLPRGASIPAP
jgi:MFS family permease